MYEELELLPVPDPLPELDYIGPDQLPELEDGSACFALAWLVGLVLAFVLGLLLGILLGRAT